jgi:hypothetical protein
VEGILKNIKPVLQEMGVYCRLSDEAVELNGAVYIKATAALINAEDGEKIEATAYAREMETKKGMDASQCTGSASTYARKYALNGLFCIDDNKDSDFTNHTPKGGEPDETRSQASDFPFCQECGARIDERVRKYSVGKFGVALCRDCQKRRA